MMPAEQVCDWCQMISSKCPGIDVHCHVERRHCVDWEAVCAADAQHDDHGVGCCHCKSVIS